MTRETRTTVRDSNDAGVLNCVRTLQLRDALGDNGKMIMDVASSKGFELRPRERVPGLSWNWLGVRDDFRNCQQ